MNIAYFPCFPPQGNGNNLLEVGLSLLQECSQTLVAIGMQTGSGLGLSIVKTVAELHGGSCGVETGPGGSTFWFELPV